MSAKRNAMLAKLVHAIKDYRGKKDPKTGKWTKPPNFKAVARVHRWLEALGLSVVDQMPKIDGFKTYDDFGAWIRML